MARIEFLTPSGCGIVAVIAENRPTEFVSIRHLGVIENGVEDTTSDKAALLQQICSTRQNCTGMP